jgi:hypothetical protein
MSSFYGAMSFTDVVLGRFCGQQSSSVGMAMLKKQTSAILGNTVACPEEAITVMNQNHIRYLELRYEAHGDRHEPNTNGKITKPGMFRRMSRSVVSTS